jgi:hypothetical protein
VLVVEVPHAVLVAAVLDAVLVVEVPHAMLVVEACCASSRSMLC